MVKKTTKTGCLLAAGSILLVVIVLGVMYRVLVVPWMYTWGATAEEIRATLPGDDLVPSPVVQTTQAVTVRANPERIYPWLMQLGVDRGGMYSYDWLENLAGLNVHTIDRLVPELQNVQPGDFFGFTPKDYAADGPGVYVMRLDPSRAMIGCFGMRSAPPPPCAGTWQLVLQPHSDGTTRLILRSRTDAASPMTGLVGAIFDPISFIMGRGMLLGFRDRIEAYRDPPPSAMGTAVPVILPTNVPNPAPAGLAWSEAKQLILDGKVTKVVQAHSLIVTLTFADGTTRTAVEPQIDEVIRVVKECGDRCKNVEILTE